MFINDKKFKKCLKEVYDTTGFDVAIISGEIVIYTTEWQMEVDMHEISKELLSAIVSMVGMLPSEEAYTVKKGECNQACMKETITRVSDEMLMAGCRAIKSPMFLHLEGCPLWRILQKEDDGRCILVKNDLLEMLDPKAVDEEEEYPQIPEYIGGKLYWQSSKGRLAVQCYAPQIQTKEEETIRALEMVNLDVEMFSRAMKKER